jgi:hypothetical protein
MRPLHEQQRTTVILEFIYSGESKRPTPEDQPRVPLLRESRRRAASSSRATPVPRGSRRGATARVLRVGRGEDLGREDVGLAEEI